MKPSQRINEILEEDYSNDSRFMVFAIKRYLDEQYEKEQKTLQPNHVHNYKPFVYSGNWGASVPPPNEVCECGATR